jgi:hypothetical protein
VDLIVQTMQGGNVVNNAAQNTNPDTLYLPLTQNAGPAMDSLVLNAGIAGIEAFGSPVDVEWQFNVQSCLPLRGRDAPHGPHYQPLRPDAPGQAYWIVFSVLVSDTVTGVSSSTQVWNPPGMQLDLDSVQGDVGDLANAQDQIAQIAAEYKDADVKSIGLTGSWISTANAQPVQAGPVVGTANLGANIVADGVTMAVIKFPEFFIAGNDLDSISLSDFFGYLTQLVSTIFIDLFDDNNAYLGSTADQIAFLLLETIQTESTAEHFSGFPVNSGTLIPPAPEIALEAKGQHGVLLGPPAGLGVGQIDITGEEKPWTGATQLPSQGPLQGNPPLQHMFAIMFDWQSNLQQAVRTLYDKCMFYYGAEGEHVTQLKRWARRAESKRLMGVNGVNTHPTELQLKPFIDALVGTNTSIMRCCVKLYNGGGRLPFSPSPVWQTACPYESTLQWDGTKQTWAAPQGQTQVLVEDPSQAANLRQPPAPAGYWFEGPKGPNQLEYDEPYTARIYRNYQQYVQNGIQVFGWGDL